MASTVLRQAIYALIKDDVQMIALGFNEDNVYPNFSPDAPAGERFLVLRWGTVARGIGGVNRIRFQAWAYNRVPDYAPISDALFRLRALLPTMIATVMAPGQAVVSVDYEGDSDDLFDDAYRAYTKWCEHTITASGS